MKDRNLIKLAVEKKLAAYRIRRNSHSWADFANAKRLIIGDKWLHPDVHDITIQSITEYLQV